MTRRRTTRGRTRMLTVTAAASALLTTVGLTAGPARSLPVTCPSAYPLTDLTVGDTVNGTTVTSGTTPSGFTGEVLGVLENGLAPGLDLVLVDLESPTIDDAGIWQGMSGSPVYASDGRLIGAVSYSLGVGPSSVAGVTPAAEMQKMLSEPPTLSAGRARVPMPRALSARVVRSGAASRTQATQALRRLRVPIGISGVPSGRLSDLSRVLGLGRLHSAGAPAGPTSQEQIPVQPGGNMAASLSYGTVTLAGVGTATMVCGTEVVGFGHPMLFAGSTTMSLHGARAVLVQEDPTVSGFKLANLGAPIGTIDQDRLSGIHGKEGAVPAGAVLRSRAVTGERSMTGVTHVTVRDAAPGVGFVNMLAAQERVLDQASKGTAWAGWTIKGVRKNGTHFRFTRRGMYADSSDVSSATAIALAGDLQRIYDNPGEVVTITAVNSNSGFGLPYETYQIHTVHARMNGSWIPVTGRQPVPLRAGSLARLKVRLTSREGAPRTVTVRVKVPVHAAGKVGTLHVTGGNNDSGYSEDFYDLGGEAFDMLGGIGDEDSGPAPTPATFPRMLEAMRAEPGRNQVVATLRFGRAPGTARQPRIGEATFNRVVGGSRTARVVALP